jgi:hypothetical protein
VVNLPEKRRDRIIDSLRKIYLPEGGVKQFSYMGGGDALSPEGG